MIIASHQPYFFPYIGYFSLISAVDKFVYFDTSQYVHRSWMRRNRILKYNSNEILNIYVGIQKPPFKSKLSECKLASDESWKKKLIAHLHHYKRKAPFYDETMEILIPLILKKEEKLVEFNMNSTTNIARMLKIKTPIYKFSDFEDKVEKSRRGYWGINFCKALGADTYINAPGGEAFYPKLAYKEAGIKLGFIQHKLNNYPQYNNRFIAGLSIIDVLMFNGFEKTSEMLKDYYIKWVGN